ncbi:sensor domain-containing protein [Pseudofrankia inefficax]|uniref:Diguanylate cyclase/phosphodiesterase with PAS/PAC sensor(S) n=1 Tax=Pseudofrankia inefficax (strain DSM 45817 / CECT 9037 / DDB 130130 / EuI1c) TaxID=298654 RepID=E3IZ78_PSEI1|nr:diguanylate cyclase [Pseudofrankia inefficax]ADP81505.1 diguanylate cyclase/phosphodiesterase with PAS/PAC sensor(s) [Pseudofrankia inefficax]
MSSGGDEHDREMGFVDLFHQLQIGLTVTRIADGRLRRVNTAACALIGRSEAELVGLDWREMIDPTQVDELNAAFSQQSWRRVGEAGRRVIRFLRPDGTVAHVLASGGIVTIDGDRCFLTQLQDITEYVSTHQQLQLVLDSTPVSVFLLDREGQVVASAGTARESPGNAAGSGLHEALGDEPAVLEMVRSAMGGQRVHSVVPSGRCWYDVHLVPVSAAGRTAVGGVVSDVTERERATAELLDRTARQTALANLAQYALEIGDELALWDLGISALTDQVNADRITVEPCPDGAAGRAGPDAEAGRDADAAPTLVRMPVGHTDEPVATVTVRRAAPGLTSDDVAFIRSVVAILGSAVLRIRMENAARFRSLHDPLTGLPNRVAILDHLRRSLAQGRPDTRRTGVLYIDLDGFKAVNDTLGHHAGDELLQAVAGRLRQLGRPTDLVGRLAGDEFAVLCEGVGGLEDLRAIGERVIHALTPPVRLRRLVSVGASIGIALAGPDLTDAEQVLDAADLAMYAAKRRGPGRCVAYDDTIRETVATHLAGVTELRQAVAAGRLVPLFQPIASSSGTVAAAEAVPCWPQPGGRLLGPEEIEPIAFEAGLSGDLDQWLVDSALRTLDAAPTPPPLGDAGEVDAPAGEHADDACRHLWIRISERGLGESALRDQIISHVRGSGPRHPRGPRLGVLIPDTMWQLDYRNVNTAIGDLAAAGVETRLDFTELGPIRAITKDNIPPGLGGIRLSDRHIHNLDDGDVGIAIIAGIVRFADLLHLAVAAQGVDTPAQLARIRALGCDLAQGAAVGPAALTPPW